MSPDRVLTAMETGSMVTMANNRTAVERRAIAEFLTGQTFANALSTAPAAARDVRRPAPGVRSRSRPGVERLGQRHLEQPVPDGRQGRTGRGRRPEAEAEMGVRLSGRSAVLLAGHRRRRALVRRQLGRQGLFAERGHRLHPLVLRRGQRRALGRQHRPRADRRQARAYWRSSATARRSRPRPGCRHGRGGVEGEGRRLPHRAHQQLADVLQRPAVRRRGLG